MIHTHTSNVSSLEFRFDGYGAINKILLLTLEVRKLAAVDVACLCCETHDTTNWLL